MSGRLYLAIFRADRDTPRFMRAMALSALKNT